MTATIYSLQPSQVQVRSGQSCMIAVSVLSSDEHHGARIVFTNMKPEAVQLFDSNERSDVIHSNKKNLVVGDKNHLTHLVGFELEAVAQTSGAIVAIEVHIEDDAQNKITQPQTMFAFVAA